MPRISIAPRHTAVRLGTITLRSWGSSGGRGVTALLYVVRPRSEEGSNWQLGGSATRQLGGLHVKAKQHDVAVANHVVLALRPNDALFAGALPTAVRSEILVRRGFGANAPALQAGV